MKRDTYPAGPRSYFGHKAARRKARNVKFAVISCFITVNWKHVAGGQHCWWRSCTHPIGEKLGLGPRGTRLCLFIQIAGKHSVFRKRGQLLLQFCPLFKQHSITISVFLTSGRDNNSSWEFSHSGRLIFGTWHALKYGFTYIHPSPKAIPHSPGDVIHSTFEEMWLTLLQSELCLCTVTPHPHYYYITVSMDINFGNIWKCSPTHTKSKFS